MQKDILWMFLVKYYGLLEREMFFFFLKGYFLAFLKRYSFLLDRWEINFQNNYGNFSHFWAVQKRVNGSLQVEFESWP